MKSKTDEEADHGLSAVSEFVRGWKCNCQAGSLVEVSAVLESQAELGEKCPIKAGTINEDGLVVALSTHLAAHGLEHLNPASSQGEGPQACERDGHHPVGRDLVIVGPDILPGWVGAAERRAWKRWVRTYVDVCLIGTIGGVREFITV